MRQHVGIPYIKHDSQSGGCEFDLPNRLFLSPDFILYARHIRAYFELPCVWFLLWHYWRFLFMWQWRFCLLDCSLYIQTARTRILDCSPLQITIDVIFSKVKTQEQSPWIKFEIFATIFFLFKPFSDWLYWEEISSFTFYNTDCSNKIE